jgi:dihydrofolate synthase/folylpolyglutamate synthase
LTQLTYTQLERELFPRLAGGIRWGLERTEALLHGVGSPHRAYRVLHVGGTNGKGSVAATLAAVLEETGKRVGLYTSPHLCTFRERIQAAGHPLSEEQILAAARRLWPTIQESGATFFEATTAIAFLALAEAGVDWAVVEVGLGGRLDATNVVMPEVAVLTNVALDHTELLGTELSSIAMEKAGIIKSGRPVVTGETNAAVLEVFGKRARELGAPLHRLDPADLGEVAWDRSGTRFRLATAAWGEIELRTPLVGPHQATNAALAVRALELLATDGRPDLDTIRAGVQRVKWPGRLQIATVGGTTWVFDAAHNPAGVEALRAAFPHLRLPRPVVLLAGFLADKDWIGMLQRLCPLADAVVLTIPPTAPQHRRWDPAAAAAHIRLPVPNIEPEFRAALDRASELALAGVAHEANFAGGTVLVTGSLHTVGDALLALGLATDSPTVMDPSTATTSLIAASLAPTHEPPVAQPTLPVGVIGV